VQLPESKKTLIRIIFSKEPGIDASFSVCPSIPYVDTTLIMTLPGIRLSELLNSKPADAFKKDCYFIATDSNTSASKNSPLPTNSLNFELNKSHKNTEFLWLLILLLLSLRKL